MLFSRRSRMEQCYYFTLYFSQLSSMSISFFQINETQGLDEQIRKYFSLVQINSKLLTRLEGSIHLIHSSHLIKEPRKTLLGVCGFLNLNCDDQYIEDCSSIIYKEGTKTRHSVVWTDEQKILVKENLQKFPSLKDYNFEN